jgi:hypothetical protein
MTEQERNDLIAEQERIQKEIKTAAFIDPRSMRRIDEIWSLLWSDGKTEQLRLAAGKTRKSHRVTSFTRDRR